MRFTPHGLSVSSRIRPTMASKLGTGSGDAPRTPRPPAFDTAAARSSYATNPMPALTSGWRIPYSLVSLVKIDISFPISDRTLCLLNASLRRSRTQHLSTLMPCPDQFLLRDTVLLDRRAQ